MRHEYHYYIKKQICRRMTGDTIIVIERKIGIFDKLRVEDPFIV